MVELEEVAVAGLDVEGVAELEEAAVAELGEVVVESENER